MPEVVQFFRRYFGPIQLAFEKTDPSRQDALRRDLEAAFSQYNRATDGTTLLDAEYLDVDAIRA